MARALFASIVVVVVAIAAADAGAGGFTYRGTVTRVVDGDTLVVRLASGSATRVRLIGVDTPERGACHAAEATRETKRLVLRRAVVLKGDPTQATRDRYGRLLAYAWIAGSKDLGYQLVAGGFGKSYVYGRPFQRLGPYRRAEARAKAARRGIWGRCAKPSATGGGGTCHPSYSPCLPIVADLDCGEIPDALKPITVKGSDPYRLDADKDGLGCE